MERLEAIDFIKGAAITGIIIFHCYEAIFGWPGHDLFRFLRGGLVSAYALNLDTWDSTLRSVLKITGLGYQGVSVFIVLSGFLQVWSSKKSQAPDKYLSKRFLRIYPLYWLAICGIVILNIILHGTPGASFPQLAGVFIGWAPLLSLNPSFWFISLIIQLYLFFPFLRNLLTNLGEKRFLLLTAFFSVAFLRGFEYIRLLPGVFFGCWLLEFSFGMVMANHFSKVNRILGIKTIIPLFLGYILGLYLSGTPITWPLARPLYGITLTLLLWSLYNIIKALPLIKNVFVFIGLNSYAMFLINQPFIQEFFVFVTGFIFQSERLQFSNLIIGSSENFLVLPISTYLPITLSYLIIMICLSVIFTRIDGMINIRLNNVFSQKYTSFIKDYVGLDFQKKKSPSEDLIETKNLGKPSTPEIAEAENVRPRFLIEVNDATKIYRFNDIEIKAINNVNLGVDRGEFIALMGPSGSGKTTLLNMIGGLDKPTSGSIYFNGEDLTKLSETRLTDFRLRNVGFVFQQYNLIDVLTALENVELPTIATGVPGDEAKKKALEILEMVGLKHRVDNRPTQLSGGEQQRVSIARALINDPSIIIADEPTGNVDSTTGLKLIRLLSDLNEERGVTIIIATHDPQIGERAHRLVRMMDGSIV